MTTVSDAGGKTIRFKSSCGVTATWRLGRTKDGKFKALSLSKSRLGARPIPLDFVPFEMMDAVYNRNITFETLADAEAYVRSL